jgi:hypothetical protein
VNYVIAEPQILPSASADLARIGSAIDAATTTAAASTTSVTVAADDEISVVVATLFNEYGRQYQAISNMCKTR